jgi:hypothetical protein
LDARLFHSNGIRTEQAFPALRAHHPIDFQAIDLLELTHRCVGLLAEITVRSADLGITQLEQALLQRQYIIPLQVRIRRTTAPSAPPVAARRPSGLKAIQKGRQVRFIGKNMGDLLQYQAMMGCAAAGTAVAAVRQAEAFSARVVYLDLTCRTSKKRQNKRPRLSLCVRIILTTAG